MYLLTVCSDEYILYFHIYMFKCACVCVLAAGRGHDVKWKDKIFVSNLLALILTYQAIHSISTIFGFTYTISMAI